MGDIKQAYANNQGFMHAEFPIHQQGQLAIMGRDMETADIIRGVEVHDGKLVEVDMNPGEAWTQKNIVK